MGSLVLMDGLKRLLRFYHGHILGANDGMGGHEMNIATKRGYTMREACEYLGGVSRTTIYRLLGEGALTSYHLGVRHDFTKESLDQLIDRQIGLEPSDSHSDSPNADELRTILRKGILGE